MATNILSNIQKGKNMASSGKWIITRRYDTYHEMTHTGTGSMRKLMLASDKQWGYLESLRAKYTKRAPLKNRPYAHMATKQIEKLLEKQQEVEKQQRLI